MTKPLKPCPFCGSADAVAVLIFYGSVWISCRNDGDWSKRRGCGAIGPPSKSVAGATRRWNCRGAA